MQVATGATVEHPATDEQPPTLDLRGEVVALLEERARFVLGRAEADPDEIVWARSLDEKELLECRDVLAEEIEARAQQLREVIEEREAARRAARAAANPELEPVFTFLETATPEEFSAYQAELRTHVGRPIRGAHPAIRLANRRLSRKLARSGITAPRPGPWSTSRHRSAPHRPRSRSSRRARAPSGADDGCEGEPSGADVARLCGEAGR